MVIVGSTESALSPGAQNYVRTCAVFSLRHALRKKIIVYCEMCTFKYIPFSSLAFSLQLIPYKLWNTSTYGYL